MSVINILIRHWVVPEENPCTHPSLIHIIPWEEHTSRSIWDFLTLETVTQLLSIIRAFHPLTAKKTRRRVLRRKVPVTARSRDVLNCTVNVSLRNAFVRDVTAAIVVTLLKMPKNGTRPSKILALKTQQHSSTDSAWKIRKALKGHKKSTIWAVNARNQPA